MTCPGSPTGEHCHHANPTGADPVDHRCCHCGQFEMRNRVHVWPPADVSACGPFVPGKHPGDGKRAQRWTPATISADEAREAAAQKQDAIFQRVLDKLPPLPEKA